MSYEKSATREPGGKCNPQDGSDGLPCGAIDYQRWKSEINRPNIYRRRQAGKNLWLWS